jgi:hypothetical protein
MSADVAGLHSEIFKQQTSTYLTRNHQLGQLFLTSRVTTQPTLPQVRIHVIQEVELEPERTFCSKSFPNLREGEQLPSRIVQTRKQNMIDRNHRAW